MQTNQPARPGNRRLWATLAALVIFAQCCVCILPVWGYTVYQRQVAGAYLEDSGLRVCGWAGQRQVSMDFSQQIIVRQAVPFQVEVGPLGVGFFSVCDSGRAGQ